MKDTWKNNFKRWMDGDLDLMEHILDTDEHRDEARAALKEEEHQILKKADEARGTQRVERLEMRGYYLTYHLVAIVSCVLLICVLLFTIANLPRYGVENPEATVVTRRYIEKGLQETGAVNIISGIILDYRAFDTLGESHVLFTALICVMILLQRDKKNMRSEFEDYYTIRNDRFHELYGDPVMHGVGSLLVPSIILYGIYVLLNGQISPGGGFSGGAVIGAGLIIFASAFGLLKVDRFMTRKLFSWIAFCSLSFYSFAKGYVFFTGANGLENHIPKGTPGAILSGGLILPLDIAVGLVVACTMYGFYSLFKRGNIGSD